MVQRLIERQRPARASRCRQRLALEKLHDQEVDAVRRVANIVDVQMSG